MANYVLVPGFWLGAWAWDEVARELRAAGHQVRAVTLTGLAERAGELSPEVGVETHVADILAAMDGLEEVVLVGHSGASVPVTAVADRHPERLSRVVYVDTAPLPSGVAVIDFNDEDTQKTWRDQVGDGHALDAPSFEEEDGMFAGLTPEQRARIRAKATPHPWGAATESVERPSRIPATPKTMIASTMPVALIRELIASGNPAFAPLGAPEWTFVELPTGHWPMFSRPAELAALL
ncbi:alpha/beta fold hydrolase [Nonomuraea roseoviolacea]|uniref:Pimeloyl-ACP methyl ester carboxylesterase n=1 Tax=Nonomuraea roseoviolacea subsp. carminata TaxID=160689 RepID=A0ABT1KCC1_9ACTN|nr:alpha/beta fold hydrolase [Nonomuraea roseoviolacea]MCP2351595.1 pimeloyl-ACP methyl ester carboxylesterase [Nonomuraea roseoviolacea subsp. carminata]